MTKWINPQMHAEILERSHFGYSDIQKMKMFPQLPKKFTFQISGGSRIYTATIEQDVVTVTWERQYKGCENSMKYSLAEAQISVGNGSWQIIEEKKGESMLPKHFTFYCPDDRTRIYTAKKQVNGLFKVTWEDSDNWVEYDESGMKYYIDNGYWRIITCIDDEEPKEEIVKTNVKTYPSTLPKKFKFLNTLSQEILAEYNRDAGYYEFSNGVEFKYSAVEADECLQYFEDGRWTWLGEVVEETPREGPAYSLSEAQAFCAANGAALLISENKLFLTHSKSEVSYCVPSVEDLQRAMQWLRDYLEAKESENA